MSRFAYCLAAFCLLGSMSVLAETQVQVVGLFPDAAFLNVDGQRKLVKVGQTGPGGVQVISADSRGAVLRVDGVERSYGLTRDYGATTGSPTERSKYSIAKGMGGHFWVAGSIQGRTVQFLVDTGATTVAMNEDMARRLGIDFRVEGVPMVVSTASGTVNAWRIKLDKVKVGPIEVLGVDAAVISGNSPAEVLLGMSFLSRVSWREEQGMLLLESKI